ncbi:hypothetical protein EW146_g982 [Bondarzewia mesenterica]|uniref:Transcription factor domain-containing protein n=1 Tax=Bondarzewia mesenterica TaxID=1095465 RepID=A0A4S4M737_9AGAM|nr:hypothetical protein EW146_g982 [Bondarzewia mesenterica]
MLHYTPPSIYLSPFLPGSSSTPRPASNASQTLLSLFKALLCQPPVSLPVQPSSLWSTKVHPSTILCLRRMSHAKVFLCLSTPMPRANSLSSRVRCDLKDLPLSSTGQQSQCSNCKERGLKCVDEFAEVKAVKLLRRGRRLQQVEAVYGKTLDEDSDLYQVPTLTPNLIPRLRPEFFSSAFFRRFHIQYPIIDPSEFCSRFFEFAKGNCNALEIPGQLIAMVLAVWAASFGVNEYGIEEVQNSVLTVRKRKDQTNDMVIELLQLIDIHGIVRKPTWDGVRALLLILPLTQDVQSPMERLVMHEATIGQVFTLCSLASVSSVGTGQGKAVDLLVRSRIFWHAHVVEGITSGLRGGRLLLSDEDLIAFQKTVPPLGSSNITKTMTYEFAYRYAEIPLELASACRKVHLALTGPRARQQDDLDEKCLFEAWSILDKSWKDFEDLRKLGTAGIVQAEEIDRYINGWQIFIFECLNVIRDALKQHVVVHSEQGEDAESSQAGSSTSNHVASEAANRLLKAATARCYAAAKQVVAIIRRHVGTPFFEYDACLARDGLFFAAFMLAGECGTEDEVKVCIQALRQMRWAFSKNEEREKTVRMAWEARKAANDRKLQLSIDFTSFEVMAKTLQSQDFRHHPPPSATSPSSVSSLVGDYSAPNTAGTDDGNWASPSSSTTASSSTRSRQDSLHEDLMGSVSHRGSPASNTIPASPTSFLSDAAVGQLQPSGLFNHVSPPSSDGTSVESIVPQRLSPCLQFFPEIEQFSFGSQATGTTHGLPSVNQISHHPPSSSSPFSFGPLPSLSTVGSDNSSSLSPFAQHTSSSMLFDPRSVLFAGTAQQSVSLSSGEQHFGSLSYYH